LLACSLAGRQAETQNVHHQSQHKKRIDSQSNHATTGWNRTANSTALLPEKNSFRSENAESLKETNLKLLWIQQIDDSEQPFKRSLQQRTCCFVERS
jgi:hypothetical protein